MALRLTAAARCAVAALAHLAGQGGGALISGSVISAASGAPGPFMNKVLRALSVAGLLRSLKGPHGGYALARRADRITLLEVVEAVDGRIPGGTESWDSTDRALDRRLGPILEAAAATVRRHLGAVRVSTFAGRRGFTFGRRDAGSPR
jgi:Rrf2 family protein